MAREKKSVAALTPNEKLAQALVPEWEQPYKIPENWCWTRIGTLSEFERGITFPASAKENELTKDNIPCLRTANVQENLEIDDLIYVNQSFMKDNEAKLVREKDIIMSSANSRELVGKVSFVTHVPFPMTFGGFVLNIRARGISSKYLFYFLRHEFLAGKFMGESTQTTNIANISTTTLGNYELPLPPLAEQQRIVDRVESLFAKLDEAKEKTQSVLNNFEVRKAAILHKAFTGELSAKWRSEHNVEIDSWKDQTIVDLCSLIVDCPHSTPEWTKSGKVCLRTTNIKEGYLDLAEVQYVSETTFHLRNQRAVPLPGDVLLTREGSIGDVGVIPDGWEICLGQRMMLLRPEKCKANFLVYFFRNPKIISDIRAKTMGSTAPRMNIKDLKNLKISCPDTLEQTEIVRILDSLFTKEKQIKEVSKAALAKIDLLKKAILARAFRGELGTNNPEEESSVELIKSVLSEKLPQDKPKSKREKKKSEVAFVTKTIMQALTAGGKITPEKLKSETGLLIDDFYDQLKTLIDSGCVIETRIDGESYLEAKNEDRQPNN